MVYVLEIKERENLKQAFKIFVHFNQKKKVSFVFGTELIMIESARSQGYRIL